MIVIFTLDDIPPEFQACPVECIKAGRLPKHLLQCMWQATSVLYATQIKCRGPGCRDPNGHMMTPIDLPEWMTSPKALAKKAAAMKAAAADPAPASPKRRRS